MGVPVIRSWFRSCLNPVLSVDLAMKRVGFLGLGIMGRRMAAVLQNNGHQVMVWNRSPGKAAELVASGGWPKRYSNFKDPHVKC